MYNFCLFFSFFVFLFVFFYMVKFIVYIFLQLRTKIHTEMSRLTLTDREQTSQTFLVRLYNSCRFSIGRSLFAFELQFGLVYGCSLVFNTSISTITMATLSHTWKFKITVVTIEKGSLQYILLLHIYN